MNVHVSYKGSKLPELDKYIDQQTEKLRKRLQVFKPDLVHLRISVDDKKPSREGANVSLDLRLPSGDIAATANGADPVAALKMAFDDLIERVAKHKDQLRQHHKWLRRKRGEFQGPEPQVPFEETIAAVQPAIISDEDIASYVNANLYKLNRFVDREIRYREANGQIEDDQVAREEVIGEAIATALGDSVEKPEKLALEPWLYRLAIQAMNRLVERDERGSETVPLDQRTRRRNVGASDDVHFQYHQPDETMTQQENIPNRGVSTPEEIAASDEMISMVELALLGAKARDREAFLLYAVEGFTPEEIAAISDRPVEQVRASVIAARDHLRKALPLPDQFKDKLLQHSKIA
jgi:DNA-directed RNA polymerase specialized sigma24 family protein/ribosome-associated translation inhibitor RaiA